MAKTGSYRAIGASTSSSGKQSLVKGTPRPGTPQPTGSGIGVSSSNMRATPTPPAGSMKGGTTNTVRTGSTGKSGKKTVSDGISGKQPAIRDAVQPAASVTGGVAGYKKMSVKEGY